MGLGVCLRLFVYARNHDFCFDERSLWGNIAGLPIYEFSSELSADQLAPFGFLILRASARFSVRRFPAGRPVDPAACRAGSRSSCFGRWRSRFSPGARALVALALFALSDDLIYYSSEVKQYSLDVAIAVAMALATVQTIGRPITGRTGWGMALLAIASPWFSFPAVFIVAGCGLALDLEQSRLAADCAMRPSGAWWGWRGA